MAIDYGGKTYDNDWFEIDARGNRLSGSKDWAANAAYAGDTGTQNPYTNEAGSSIHDASGAIPGNEPGSTLPKGAAPGGWLDNSRIQAYLAGLTSPTTPPTAAGGGSPYGPMPSFPMPPSASPGSPGYDPNQNFIQTPPSGRLTTRTASRGGSDADRIRDAYRASLGREASNDEVNGWLSGSYGGGGIEGWLQQIQNSHEAQQRGAPRNVSPRPGESGPQMPVDPGGGSAPGVPQIPPGLNELIARLPTMPWLTPATSVGTPITPTTSGPQGGDFQSWFSNLTNGKRPSPKTLKELEPVLAQYGIKLGPPNARGWSDGIFLPNGQFVDVIMSATEDGGQSWGWLIADGSGGNTAANLPNTFNDQWTAQLEELLKTRIGSLGPVNDPNRAAYEQSLKDRAAQLAQAEPAYKQLLDYLQTRFTDLQGPGYTGAENEVIRTGALDPIEQDRAAAKKRVEERLAARGLTPDSGIYQAALLEVDNAFDGMRGTTQTALTTNDLNRREDRASRAESIGAQLVDIPEGRKREQLDVFSAIEMLSAAARGENDARSREAIGYGGALADLGPQRLQLAMQAAGMGGSPESMFNSLLQMAGLNQNSALFANQNRNSMWSGLGSIMAVLANSGR